jgi:threonine/homoserine/homoserine lactone efflux protein
MPELGLHDLALFAFTVLVLNATPGVDVIYTVTRTLQDGARAGLVASAGIAAGCVVHALLAAFGLAALLAVSQLAFALLKWAGAAYLAWLAWGMLRAAWRGDAGASTAADSPVPPPDLRAVFRQGLLTNLLNPKVALFFLAFLPQFIDPAAAHKTLAFLLLGGWLIVQSLVFLIALVWLTLRLKRLSGTGSARLGCWLNGLGGGLFLLLAARLASSDAR